MWIVELVIGFFGIVMCSVALGVYKGLLKSGVLKDSDTEASYALFALSYVAIALLTFIDAINDGTTMLLPIVVCMGLLSASLVAVFYLFVNGVTKLTEYLVKK